MRADLRGLPTDATLVELGPVPTELLAKATDYAPTDRSFQRAYRLRLVVDVPRETVAAKVVEAVEKNRRHMRLPKRAILFPVLAEVPRRVMELTLTGIPHQVK